MKEILLATNNAHKLREARAILEPFGFFVISLAQAGISSNPEETGESFAQNALIKAQAVAALCPKRTILADDSGLCIEYFNGYPGLYSSRFLGEDTSYYEKNEIVLRLLRDVKNRHAWYTCAAVLYQSGEYRHFEAQCHGEIGFRQSGQNGFGFDPIFVVNNHSLAELSESQKNQMSHRYLAFREVAEALGEKI
ncbi:MAG: RdgB/HAM1 family non-canonical purine NTP pyrophosphatase [Erysipelotrichaceae bacterium]|jgi:XTP/dITP diphosphohydrolase|nr:RdgB/HAM1 family non-canonical purine NTP pyrophosphatase [Erysipelotrichaceae bacterium]